MMIVFIVIRVIIVAAISVSVILLCKKTNTFNKKAIYFASILATCLLIVLSITPIENLFVTFSTPESAYNYITSGSKTVKAVIEGEESSFVIGDHKDTDNYLIIPKVEQGWQVALGIDTNLVYNNLSDGIVVNVYQYRDSNDYYVIVYDSNNNIQGVVDNRGSIFVAVEKQANNQHVTKYYAFVANYDTEYEVRVRKTGDGLREP